MYSKYSKHNRSKNKEAFHRKENRKQEKGALKKPDRQYESPHEKKRYFIADAISVLLLLAILFPIGMTRYDVDLDLIDEGCLAYGAMRVMDGQIPQRDFESFQPPLAFYTVAATFKVLGASLLSLRIFGLGIYLLTPLLIYAITRHLAGPALSFAAAVPTVMLGISNTGFVPYPVWQGIIVSLVAVFLFLRISFGATPSHSWLTLLLGVLCAVSVLLRHDQGFYLSVAIAAFVCVRKDNSESGAVVQSRKRFFALWFGGMALVLMPCGIYWLAVGAVPEMYAQLVEFPLTTYAKTSSKPFPHFKFGDSLAYNAATLLFYLPPVVAILAAFWLAIRAVQRRFSITEAKIAFMTLWCLLSFCQVLARSDESHLVITLPPFFVLCAWCWREIQISLEHRAAARTKSPYSPVFFKHAASGCMAVLAVSYLLVLKSTYLPAIQDGKVLNLARGGIRTRWAADIESFVKDVQRMVPEDKSILCLPQQPMFYFLCERRNPTRWNYLWPGDQTPEDHQDMICQVQKDPPRLVMISGESAMECIAPTVLDYIHSEYKHTIRKGQFFMYFP